MSEEMTQKTNSAPIVKRIVAFCMDAVVAFIPAFVMYIIFTGSYAGKTPIWYESPIIAAVSMYDLPGEVNEKLNTFEDTTQTYYNVSLGATACRAASWLSIGIYVFYSTFCVFVFDGQTVGKRLMHLRVVIRDTEPEPEEEEAKKEWAKKNVKKLVIREVAGKVVLNSIPVFPVISVFTMLFTKERLTLHDMMGKTRVIEEK
jgi:hypothetical protein